MRHEIIFEDWHYSCGEPGCCDEYGTRIIVDGKTVAEDCSTVTAVEDVLNALGIEHEITIKDENGTEY